MTPLRWLALAFLVWWPYPNSLGLSPTWASWYGFIPSHPSVGIIGAPLHGIVCVRGTIAELPTEERRALYFDGANVGHPGYRCQTFR